MWGYATSLKNEIISSQSRQRQIAVLCGHPQFSPEKKRELLCERNIAEQLGEGGPRPSLAKYDLRIRGRFKRLRRKHERRRKLRALHGSTEQAAPTSALFLAVPEPFDLGVRLWLARFGEVKRSGVLRVVGSDLAHQAVHRHGITHEPHAVRNYERALRCRGHSIQTTCCGIMVDPSLPWLGASPDRLVYDPKEPVPHGVLEVKCPYTMYHSADPDSQTFYMRGTHQCKGIFRDPEQRRSSGSQSFTVGKTEEGGQTKTRLTRAPDH
ncbi:hypothetical protein HPB47_016167 [Ixodes persulcatus]|uniref:Uncharacterized protein n=1 Tax=Ixodes persulcatus TaxID=34615 RepID=A0AC60QV74_IXOPE|nr:hypothetical protein HPB47_016167 [Ixodes persulcatus]